jgi:hypothetical protein
MRRLGAILALAILLPGCAAPKSTTGQIVIPAAQYADAFEITGDVLRECRFVPDRVDARDGVITTYPKHSAGLAMPWDLEQSTLDDELADLFNEQHRQVRVTFAPVAGEARPEDALGAPVPDMRTVAGSIQIDVQVFIERVRRPGRRLEPSKINLSSYTRDPSLIARGVAPMHTQTMVRDDDLARRLADIITQRLDRKLAKAEGAPTPTTP